MSNQQDIQSAIQSFQSGNIKQAKQILGNYISSYPDDINANLLSAAISATESDFSMVIEKCRKVLAIDPSNIRAAYNAAVASEKLKKIQDVKNFSLQVLKYDVAHVPAKLLLAGSLYDLNERDESQQQCIQIILANKNNAEVVASIFTLFSTRKNTEIAEAVYEYVLKNDTENMVVLFNLVALNIARRDFVKAEKYSNRLISLDSNNLNTINARVIIFYAQGEREQCVKLIESLPQPSVLASPVIMMKLAECYMELFNNEKAISIFKQCITANINVAECFHNIGIIEDRLGNVNAAMQAYKSSLALVPDSLNTNYNLAFVLDKKGDKHQAIKVIRKCFEIQDSPKVRQAFVTIVSSAVVDYIDESIENIILDIVSDDVTNSQSLSVLVSKLLRRRFPVINRLFYLANNNRYSDFVELLEQRVVELKDDSMLQLFFSNLPVTEYDFECFSKMLRRALLLQCYKDKRFFSGVDDLCASLAICCYVNGYVFTTTEDEYQVINEILDAIGNTKGAIDKRGVTLLAMYRSLYKSYRDNGLIIDSRDYEGVYSDLLVLQLDDNINEDGLYDSIEHHADINNEISLTVKKQYEGNPYPVWRILNVREPESISSVIESVTLHTGSVKLNFDNPDILIAGCGTGSHALQTAMRIQHKSMTAIDLSRRSLAFAKRKAAEYEQDHIDFKQMDILNVSSLNKSFDIIESVGVLHHMQVPLTGLRCLVDILNPGGLMNIGLYSKLARRYIIKSKKLYDDPDRHVSDDEIREARVVLMNSDDKELVNNMLLHRDFYSLHDCRDLIFHENENNYDISELSNLLKEAGLEFIGFDSHETAALSRFKKMFPEKNSQSRLENWSVFEEKYPDTFSGMYVFWCRKDNL